MTATNKNGIQFAPCPRQDSYLWLKEWHFTTRP